MENFSKQKKNGLSNLLSKKNANIFGSWMDKLSFFNWRFAHQEYKKLIKNQPSKFYIGCVRINIESNLGFNGLFYVRITEDGTAYN